MIIGCTVQTAAQNIGMFIGCRFLIGFGLSFACLAAPVLITELAFPTHRAPITSLYNSSWYLGSIIAAWTTYGTFRIGNTWAWRIPSLLQGLPSFLQFGLIFFIPESPRWLVNNGREEQAARIIAKYHCGGDQTDPLVDFEIAEIKEAIRLEKEASASSSYKSLFATKGNRKRMIVIIAIAFFSQWSGNGIVSYYFNIVLKGIGITSEGQKTLLNGILQVYNYVSRLSPDWLPLGMPIAGLIQLTFATPLQKATAIFGALTVDRFGRRFLFLTSAAGMCLSYTMWTICSAIYAHAAGPLDSDGNQIDPTRIPNKGAGRGVLGAIFLYYVWDLLSFYSVFLPMDSSSFRWPCGISPCSCQAGRCAVR